MKIVLVNDVTLDDFGSDLPRHYNVDVPDFVSDAYPEITLSDIANILEPDTDEYDDIKQWCASVEADILEELQALIDEDMQTVCYHWEDTYKQVVEQYGADDEIAIRTAFGEMLDWLCNNGDIFSWTYNNADLEYK